MADAPLSLGLQAARVEDMGPRNQRTLKSWACKLFTALAQLLKAGTPAAPSAVLTLIIQVIGPRKEVVPRTHLFEVSFAEALKRTYACWKVKGLGQRGWFRQSLSIPAAVLFPARWCSPRFRSSGNEAPAGRGQGPRVEERRWCTRGAHKAHPTCTLCPPR
jgi:hypothetical protein